MKLLPLRFSFTWLLTVMVCSILLSGAPPMWANVGVVNGNFFIGYTDIAYPGNENFVLERVFNSKTAYKGIFGWGWGCDYEQYLSVHGDGSLVLHHFGGGAEERYDPPSLDPVELAAAFDLLVKVAFERADLTSKDDELLYRKRLSEDEFFRRDEWDKYFRLGLVPAHQAPFGIPFRSNRFGARSIMRLVGVGYLMRDLGNADNERVFDEAGHLRVMRRGAFTITFDYNSQGRLATMTDSLGRHIFLFYNERGLVSAAKEDSGRYAFYRYDDKDHLVYSSDVDGNIYEHQYNERHNMMQIRYTDATTLDLGYHPRWLNDNIQKTKTREGITFLYNYRFDPHDDLHFKAWVTRLLPAEKDRPTHSDEVVYDFYQQRTPNGVLWYNHVIGATEQERTEVTYSLDRSTMVLRGTGGERRYWFDGAGRVIRAQRPSENQGEKTDEPGVKPLPVQTIEHSLAYNEVTGQVTQWTTQEVGADNKMPPTSKPTIVSYDYSNGTLLKAARRASETQPVDSVEISFDVQQRIHKLTTNEQWTVEFSYSPGKTASGPTHLRATRPDGQIIDLDIERDKEAKFLRAKGPESEVKEITALFTRLSALTWGAGRKIGFDGLTTFFIWEPDVCRDCGPNFCANLNPFPQFPNWKPKS